MGGGDAQEIIRREGVFAQVWYVLEGEFRIGAFTVGPGAVVFHADPHYEEDLSTETGGLMFFVQYQGPTTGGQPIYDGRFNVAQRKPLSEERLDNGCASCAPRRWW